MNLFNFYRGRIIYRVMSPNDARKLVAGADGDLLVFEFGDRVSPYRQHLSGFSRLKNLEQVSVCLNRLILSDKIDIKNFLIDDAYIMQSAEGTALSKGAIIKAFLSLNKMLVKFSGSTVIFISETECPIMARHLRTKKQK